MTGDGASVVVGTAGHIDHGKSALVRRLTGIDPDTLPEEQERGITIALGFVPLDLPDGRRLALVDVPGHERLVRTMVAGATGIDAVLLCVSAVDGVMPQTREHLHILRLLGLTEGAVVLTMADLVDDELLELASEDVADLVRGTFLQGRPVIPFSAVTGRGQDELMAALQAFEARARPLDGPFRLPVDRAFVRPGFGTVVTGTAWSGALHDGETLSVLPGGLEVRVRGIQVHGQASEVARAGWRVALNLAGVDREAVGRGTVLVRGKVPEASMVDVRVHLLPEVDALPDGAPVRLLHGTAERLGRLHLAEDRDTLAAGASAFAQIRLDAPLPCLPRDRFVLRRPSPALTLGGGEVVDPWAPRMRRRDRERWGEELARLAAGDVRVWLERAGEEGLSPAEWDERSGGADGALRLGDRVVAPTVAARLQGALLEALGSFHQAHPLSLGAHRRELRRGRLGHLSDRLFDALVDRLAASGAVAVEGPLLRAATFAVAPTPEQEALRERLRASVRAAGLAGVKPPAVHAAHEEPEVAALLHLLEREGAILAVPGLGLVACEALDELASQVRAYLEAHQAMSPGDFKELTGLSRKSAIPLLEWLDRSGLTRRQGDTRVRR